VGVALVEPLSEAHVDALAVFVGTVADHRQISARAGGVLRQARDGHPVGAAFVTITVPTADAANLAAERLRTIAGVDDETWRSSWRLVDGPQLELDIYPDFDQPEARAFVARELAMQAGRRPELESYVRRQLAGAPDVLITDSVIDDEGAFVEINVTSADGAERAERALVGVATLETPWRLDENTLRARIYL
jgi:hypothetical protein